MLKAAAAPSPSRSVLEPTNRLIYSVQNRMEPPFSRVARDFNELKYEQARLDTFSLPPGWPVSFIRPEDCASSGFFFLQDGDKVQCAFCRGVAGEWEEGDNPSAEHRRHFPRCPFVCNLPVGNVRIGHEEEAAELREQEEAAGIDVCGPFAPISRSFSSSLEPGSSSVRGAQPLNENMNDVATKLAIKVCGNGPVHANLVTLQSRLKTFSNWPETSGQKPDALADAGFFYIGKMDHVKCFYCDGGLRNWELADNPWLEHARWFPNCSYVVLNKGDNYVKQVTKAKPPVVSQELLNKLPPVGLTKSPRRVSDQELRDLMDTPVVQAALEMGMELGKVKGALQRKMQQTGVPFLTTESLLEAVLGRDEEYFSDSDTDPDEDDDEYEPPSRHYSVNPLNLPMFNGSGSTATSEASSSSSGEHSSGSGDEDSPVSNPPIIKKTPASRTSSGDSGVSTMSVESSSGDEPQSEGETGISSTTNENEKSADKKQNPEENTTLANSSDADTIMTGLKKELQLEEELRQLREVTQCKICMDNRVEVVFLPCGHLVSCTRCATALSNCAVCRQPIKAYVKTYLS